MPRRGRHACPSPRSAGEPLAACSTPANGTANPATQQEFVTRIVGTWLVCSQPTFFGTAEVGVQITSDGHWAKLLRNSAGQLVASSGDRDEGTWKRMSRVPLNFGGGRHDRQAAIMGSS